ncbi:MAG: ATP-dependent DNA helicase RecG [Phycisphaeraceae bacterium]|nr:ATP-dependent DNA helicase RecG [Phycisphaeraceae bacterium]
MIDVDGEIRLSTWLREIAGVGERRSERFARLGIQTIGDLLRHLPMRYEEQSAESSIDGLVMGAIGSARGTIAACRPVGGRRGGRSRFEAMLEDQGERLQLVWFNAGYLHRQIHPGMTIRVQGKVASYGDTPQMVNPRWEKLDDLEQVAARGARLRPVYPATEDLGSASIEKLIAEILPRVSERIVDPLPLQFVQDRAMAPLAEAIRMAHQPEHEDEAAAARRRLAYNELLLVQLAVALKRHYNRHVVTAPALRWSDAIDRHIRERFPFELTDAQDHVVREIAGDLQREEPMNRLLQGDVGSGKTVVALYALLMAAASGNQGVLMAPTEVLAEQHFLNVSAMLEGAPVRLELLTAGVAAAGTAARRRMLEEIGEGAIDIVIGTQALATEATRFPRLAVVVVDEQHRFGVMQRAALRAQLDDSGDGPGRVPHQLVMTATPIPRTLSLTVFGDLDVSTIRRPPPGRQPIATRSVGNDKTDEVYGFLAGRLAKGEQAYVVVPAIEGEEDDEGADEARPKVKAFTPGPPLKNVAEHAAWLQKRLDGFDVGTMHGRMPRREREVIMQRFREGEIHVLVATTVIEVGVDVPNATVMVVEHADRFGLAQLHQLRGRIGRGTGRRTSVCVYIADPQTDEARRRLEAIVSTTDGFRIAEQDFEIRGMGEFFGTRQHGDAPLRVARLPRDMALLRMARRDGADIVEGDPQLTDPTHRSLRHLLVRQYGEMVGLVDVA